MNSGMNVLIDMPLNSLMPSTVKMTRYSRGRNATLGWFSSEYEMVNKYKNHGIKWVNDGCYSCLYSVAVSEESYGLVRSDGKRPQNATPSVTRKSLGNILGHLNFSSLRYR